MTELKQISKAAIPSALKKAERYRLLNDPGQAESICLDILAADPDNSEAVIMLILSLSDELCYRVEAYGEALDLIKGLEKPYEQAYYRGVLCERRARAVYASTSMGKGFVAFEWFHRALDAYAEAEKIRPDGNDDPLYRWNAVARTLNRHTSLQPAPEDLAPQMME